VKKNKLPNYITILVLTLISIVMWISFSVYRALSQKPESDVPQEISNPLTPNLDKDSLNKIQSRIFMDDSQIPEISVTNTVSPTPTSLETPTPIPPPTPASSSGTQ
jgi:hypothetical protein